MSENIKGAIKVSEVIKDKRSRLQITYKDSIFPDLEDFMAKFSLAKSKYNKLRRLGYSIEISLLYLLNDLYKLDRTLSKEIGQKLYIDRR